MYRASSLRSAAVAMTLAVTMSLPFTLAHAADTKPFNPVKTGCEAAGYQWDDKLGCGNKPCKNWQFGVGRPGDTLVDGMKMGRQGFCDGFTGQWEVI
jgi:hypothetical protein